MDPAIRSAHALKVHINWIMLWFCQLLNNVEMYDFDTDSLSMNTGWLLTNEDSASK